LKQCNFDDKDSIPASIDWRNSLVGNSNSNSRFDDPSKLTIATNQI